MSQNKIFMKTAVKRARYNSVSVQEEQKQPMHSCLKFKQLSELRLQNSLGLNYFKGG